MSASPSTCLPVTEHVPPLEGARTLASGRRRRIAVVLSFLTLMTAPLPQRAAAAVEADLLPDLAMARPVDLRLVKSADGQRRLRFTANIVNIGEGPFETRASRASSSQATMPVKQRIYDAAGGHRVVSTSAIASYSGDGHDHWHVQRVAAYGLYDVVNGRAIARSSKVGFCLFDTRPYRLTLPHAPVSRGYGPSGCGTRTALSLRHGISVGWADRYGWELRYQSINVSHLPPGEYLLKVTADPNGFFVERSDTNNCNWTRLRLPSSGDRVTILGWGAGCALPGAAPTPTPTPTPLPNGTPTPTPSPTPVIPPTGIVQSTRSRRAAGGLL
jgi:hypothetical protein